VVPVVPVALVAAALTEGPGDRGELVAQAEILAKALTDFGAELRLAPQGIAATVEEGLAPLIARGIVTPDLKPVAAQRSLLQFYAASVQQRLKL
jgi:hypothetical protein